MKTTNLLVTVVVIAGLVVFAIQNLSPALPLVVLGMRTLTFPLAFWLMGAIALGSLTALFLIGLIAPTLTSKRNHSRYATNVPPRSPRDPYTERNSTWTQPSDSTVADADLRDRAASRSEADSVPNSGTAKESWQAWNQFTTNRWDDWNRATAAESDDEAKSSGKGKGRKLRGREKERFVVEESFNEISEGWDEAAFNDRFVQRGGSYVEDSLDDLAEGWDDYDDDSPLPPPSRDYERPQTPRSVFQSGTVYSYRYRDEDEQVTPRPSSRYAANPSPDEDEDWEERADDYEDEYEDEVVDRDNLGSPQVGPDGVYDADYRVIIPPYRPLDNPNND